MNALVRFARGGKTEDRCGLCAAVLGERHPHLVELSAGKLLCSCPGCATVLGHGSGKFRKVPERVVALQEFRMGDDEWQALAIPVGMAFFHRRSRGGVAAFYPSPLGAVETSVPEGAWERLLRDNPALGSMEADVEALLVRRAAARREYFIAPLDECYGLIGLLRREWRGFTGGDSVEPAVERFFEGLRSRSGGPV